MLSAYAMPSVLIPSVLGSLQFYDPVSLMTSSASGCALPMLLPTNLFNLQSSNEGRRLVFLWLISFVLITPYSRWFWTNLWSNSTLHSSTRNISLLMSLLGFHSVFKYNTKSFSISHLTAWTPPYSKKKKKKFQIQLWLQWLSSIQRTFRLMSQTWVHTN